VVRGLVFAIAWVGLGCSFDSSSAGDSGLGEGEGSSSATGDPEPSAVTTATASESDGETTTSTTTTGGADESTSGTDGGSTSTSTDTSGSSGPATSGSSSSSGGDAFVLCDDADADLRACYDFDGVAGGALTDLSMNGNDGSVGAVGTEPGPFGDAVRLSDRAEISVPDSVSLDIEGSATWEAWVYLDTLPMSGRMGIIDNEGQYSMIVYAGQGIRCNGGGLSVFAAVPAEQWVHLACTYDSDALTAWVDGVEVVAQSGGGSLVTAPALDMALGDTSPTFVEPMDGLLGAVRIWSVARTEEQIAEAAATPR